MYFLKYSWDISRIIIYPEILLKRLILSIFYKLFITLQHNRIWLGLPMFLYMLQIYTVETNSFNRKLIMPPFLNVKEIKQSIHLLENWNCFQINSLNFIKRKNLWEKLVAFKNRKLTNPQTFIIWKPRTKSYF